MECDFDTPVNLGVDSWAYSHVICTDIDTHPVHFIDPQHILVDNFPPFPVGSPGAGLTYVDIAMNLHLN